GALCGLVGVYVVLRRMSYIGHGLSHAIFGGAVASYVLQINFYVGAGIWGVVSALLINSVARRRKIGADAAIGIVTTASFAIGVPAIVARLVTDSFGKMLVLSTVVGAACGFAGMYSSFYFDVASGSTIVLVAAAVFVVVFAATALTSRRRLGALQAQGTGAGA